MKILLSLHVKSYGISAARVQIYVCNSRSQYTGDGLLAYIRSANRKRKSGKLKGGIVTPASRADHSQWKVYAGKGARMNSRDLSDWDWLQL